MTPTNDLSPPSISTERKETSRFVFLLFLNGFNAFVLFGLVPPLIAYIFLPYGQKALYYSTFLSPLSVPLALLLSLPRPILSVHLITIGSISGWIWSTFLIIIAAQSPCPWWADSSSGALILIVVRFFATIILVYLRIVIGNQIKVQWSNPKGLFYFGVTGQFGSVLGTIPTYLLVNVFGVFIARKPCEVYCVR
jgi:hypothetical protein